METKLVIVIVVAFLTACATASPTPYPTSTPYPEVAVSTPTPETTIIRGGPPAYIEDLVVYKQDLGVVAYFVLADEMGRETTTEGEATLRIWRKEEHICVQDSSTLVYENTVPIDPGDFRYEDIGEGEYKENRLIYSLGWIGFKDFRKPDFAGGASEVTVADLGETGVAEIVVVALDGQTFTASTDITW